jgi:CTP:molybdopterin cytidylyltransferase MocA
VAIAAVVLAAGESTRFGSPKQHLLLPTVLARVGDAPVDEIVVVRGAHDLAIALASTDPDPTPVRIVACPDWQRGPGASLRCGLAALGPDVEAAVVVLADGPNLAPESIERVLGVWREEGGVIAASYAGARGHPLAIGRENWQDVPDGGLNARPARLVPCDDLGAPGDVDTPEDLPADLETS